MMDAVIVKHKRVDERGSIRAACKHSLLSNSGHFLPITFINVKRRFFLMKGAFSLTSSPQILGTQSSTNAEAEFLCHCSVVQELRFDGPSNVPLYSRVGGD